MDDPYEEPTSAEVECSTGDETVEESVGKIMAFLESYTGPVARA